MPNDDPDDGKVQSVECKTQFQQYGKWNASECVSVFL